MKRGIVEYTKWLLPVLFSGYFILVSLFSHVHIYEGIAIVHAHPFKKNANSPQHTHTSFKEILFFQALSIIQATDGAIQTGLLEAITGEFHTLLYTVPSIDLHDPIIGHPSLRGPPSLG
ncbi:hypothetical protein D0T51_05440 [Parabacteroides sp. 52]|uniref:hypothetical protein n=1 Tax=unclassified Parabacteroides TaxID=2649774 RepID=UPI0013D59E1B|nr:MULTISPECIES: hypothetical protein [unclassified Parabacteroides]MDH6534595.1 hypothetical protein [Parabacteroides sp. PM5-20]NDV55173.1 hypothetical protein [Parabacteroides sp. 52]